MGRTRIKICGVRDCEAAVAAVEAGADAVGLVFAEGSPRRVTVEEAREVAGVLPAFVEPVGLFVDRDAEEVKRVADLVGLRTVQLHGREDAEYVAGLERLRVIKAVGFDAGDVEGVVKEWGDGPVNLAGLLWDTPAGVDGAARGGSGEVFDWEAMARLKRAGKFGAVRAAMIVAGGLTAGNVGRAMELVRPYGVDVSSGVETSRGVKDAGKIREFCEAVRGADRKIG